jgi:hypothetical protein
MLEIKKVYNSEKLNKLINNSIKYLKNNINNKKLDPYNKSQIFYALTKAGQKINTEVNESTL